MCRCYSCSLNSCSQHNGGTSASQPLQFSICRPKPAQHLLAPATPVSGLGVLAFGSLAGNPHSSANDGQTDANDPAYNRAPVVNPCQDDELHAEEGKYDRADAKEEHVATPLFHFDVSFLILSV